MVSQHLARCPSTSSRYSSNLAWSQPPSASPNSLDYSLQVRMIKASKGISPNSHHLGLLVYLLSCSISANKFPWSWPPQVYLQTNSSTISECISKFTRSQPPSESPTPLDYCLQVHLQSSLITASECISECTRSTFSGAPRNALKHCLQLV